MRRLHKPSTVALALIAGAGPFSTDTYVSALPSMQQSLHTSALVTQLTATACIIGLAIGMSLSGPLSDAAGRRPFLLGGSAAYLVCSVLCALAPSAPILVLARFAQGLAAGSAASIGRAVVTDRFSGSAAAKRYGTLTSVALLAPVVAPAVGGAILSVSNWRAVFWFMAALGAVMLLLVVAGIPESLPRDARQPHGLPQLGARIADLLRDPRYRHPLAVQCLAVAGLFIYVGGSPFVFQAGMGVSATRYALVFAVNAAAMAAGSLVFRFTVARWGPKRLRTVGIVTTTAATSVLVLVAAVTPAGDGVLGPVWALLAVTLAGMGLAVPAAMVLAQEAGARSAGTASSLLGGSGYLAAAIAVPLTGLVGGSLLAMAALMAAMFLLSGGALVFGARSETRARPQAQRP